MAVIDFKETTVRSAGATGTEVDYTRTFRVRVDNRNDQLGTIYNATAGLLPRYLDPHPENLFARCRKLAAKPTTDHWQWWTITAEYSSAPLTTEEKERKEQNPLNRKAKIRWTRNRYTEPIYRDKEGKAILNSAGDYYDPPPERLTGYWVASITKNVTGIPTWVLDWDNVVNQDTFQIQGRTVLPRCALLVPGGISDEMEENDVKYHEISFELEFRRPPDIDGAQVLSPAERTPVEFQGHDLILLDQGLRVVSTTTTAAGPHWTRRSLSTRQTETPLVVNATDGNGDEVNAPVPLDGDGNKLENPAPDTVFYFAYEVYKTADFSQLPLE